MEIQTIRRFGSPFQAFIQDWKYGVDGSMTLNTNLQKVHLRGQPIATVSLGLASVNRGDEVRVLAWSGDWLLIRKEAPFIEGWLQAKTGSKVSVKRVLYIRGVSG